MIWGGAMEEHGCAHNLMETLAARAEAAEREGRAAHLRVVAAPTRPRRLLLCLDGVPFEVLTAARQRGLFDDFGEPARLLSPFPTLTNVALARMLGASVPHGYESLYFDREERELRGGIAKYIGRRTPDKVPSSYMDELDYQEPLPFEFLIYVATDAVWRADMRRFRERFLAAPPTRDFFGFLKATDGLLHIGGPRRLQVALESLDRILRGLRAECGQETEIVLFSDHGMNLEENRRVHLLSHLKLNGYEVVTQMREGLVGRRRVSAPGFGLCGYAALYCGEETDRAELCGALASLEGVDFSLQREERDASVLLTGRRGRARIHRRAGSAQTFYRYEQLDGDPLQLSETVAALAGEGLLDAEGFAPDAVWLARTALHIYPDALSNLYESLCAPRVQHTADVLVSLDDGYYFGSTVFSHLARLLATHGNALRPSSTAFLMSTHRSFPTYVRAGEARPFLRD
ncbi:MAG: alkaline phosphatase family protein [Acidobacteria bacterium]|nr:alkaline phosphatase family protein [Acidobacteriota bacterium]